MPIIAKNEDNGGNFEKTPSGTHQAVCYAVWDLGFQKTTYNNQEKIQHKAVISWEINKTITKEGEYHGKRFVISNRYTVSMYHESHLRKHLESWFGRSFEDEEKIGYDLEKLVGKNCLLNIVHNEKDGKTYANISGVIAVPEGTETIMAENNIEPPEWVKKIQADSVQNKQPPIEYSAESASMDDINEALHSSEVPEDEIPFVGLNEKDRS